MRISAASKEQATGVCYISREPPYLVVASRYDHNYQSVRSFFEVFRPFPIFSKKQAMGRKYTFKDQDRPYFVTFTVIHWLDVYIREIYRDIFYDSISFCQREKGLEVYAYCIMTSHIHMIIGRNGGLSLSDIVRDLKSFTSRHTRKAIESNCEESKKEWMMWMMRRAGLKNNRNKDFQFWFQHNHPIELSTNEMLIQRLSYIHNNPVVAGFVEEPTAWLHSSARDYAGEGNGRIELIFIE